MLAPGIPTNLAKFAIGFDQRDRERVHALWERIFDSNQWSEGELTKEFEAAWTGWNGPRAGTFGDVGVWSFAPTKTISTGEGGMLVSQHTEAIEFARTFRNYGKPDYAVHGLNFRLNEFTAALGIVQVERLDEIVAW